MPTLFIVGEAPGAAEAETGQPFMGKSGQLLDLMLEELMIHAYITNVCKCRPPNNRKPRPNEVQTCSRLYLNLEIDIIQPKVILLLGRTAIDWAYEGQPFVRHQAHKMVFRGLWRRFIPTWHPAYCLRSGIGATKQLMDSLLIARQNL